MLKLFDGYLDTAERGFDVLPLSQIYIGIILAIGLIGFLVLMIPLFIIGIFFGRKKQ